LAASFPNSKIDFLLRDGNETLLDNNPNVNSLFVWRKRSSKYRNLFRLIRLISRNRYDYIVNVHRFSSSGIITAFSNASSKIGFDKNPLSFFYDKKVAYQKGSGKHEIERNQELIDHITDSYALNPKLYPSNQDYEFVEQYKSEPYCCIAPASVWFTKQYAKERWVELIDLLNHKIYLLGGNSDQLLCERIIKAANKKNIINLSGKLTFLQTAALMKDAKMNYVNDSAPMHIASSMNASVTAVYCSTVPEFGFGPLSDDSRIVQIAKELECRPCGLHGKKTCPEKHFDCAYGVSANEVLGNE
jgi:heptosyltransferase-2